MLAFVLSASLLACVHFCQRPAEVSAGFSRAVELQRQGDLEGAAEEYRRLLAAAPDYAEAHANYGAVLSRLGRYGEAVAAYETALRLNPSLVPVLLNLGIAHYRVGRFAEAVEALGKFNAAAPGHPQARQLLGISLVELGRESEAVGHLEPAVVAAPDELTALYYLGLAYLRLKRPELEAVIGQLSRSPRGGALANMLRGQSYLDRFEFPLAAARLEEAEKEAPDLPRLQGSLGLAYLKTGRTADAIARFERELARSPGDFFVLYYLAYAHEKAGSLDEARRRAEAALQVKETSAEANKLLGQILFKQGQETAALKYIERAVAQAPLDTEGRYLLARVYQRLGRGADSKREFAEVERLKALERERGVAPKP